ncbi:uncharacterized protein LOC126841506 [Adelges cooleyi]|uniref:uncharacterized protein LOC126841506 n=1 Tax=Adelges cooleyi TaxID=133065 RepID=UPI0021800C79|nr:uncharacterized protein LOC126841506 [Adelges cooleyi]
MNTKKYILVLCFTINILVQTVAFRFPSADEVAVYNFVVNNNQDSGQETALTTAQLLNILGDKYVNFVNNYLTANNMTRNDLNLVDYVLFWNIVVFICEQKKMTVTEFLRDQVAIDRAIKRFNSNSGHTGPLTTMELSEMLGRDCLNDVASYIVASGRTLNDFNEVNDDLFGDMVLCICMTRQVSVEHFLSARLLILFPQVVAI